MDQGQVKNLKDQISPKQLFSLILILVVVVLALSMRTWYVSLKLPFVTPESQRTALNSKSNPTLGSEDSPYLATAEVLKSRDTDIDGLSDYDELYIYHTSPYIADTDSDGLNDGQEVKSGSNPNCAQGKDCSGAVSSGVVGASTTNMSAQQIRELLAKSGVAPEELAKMDDQALLKMYQETVAGLSQSPVLTQDQIIAGPKVGLDSIQNLPEFLGKMSGLSIPEIRQNLLAQGFNKAELDKINDEQLKDMWLKVIDQSVKESQVLKKLNPNPDVTQ